MPGELYYEVLCLLTMCYRIRGIVENVTSAWNGENGIVGCAINARME